jgi:hypothetical protein
MNEETPDFTAALEPLRKSLIDHRLYGSMENLPALRLFMQQHVFAVWDFMSLLKTLQRGLTCVEVPWLPSPEPKLARLVNEIVLGEESDLSRDGTAICHFDLYLQAMHEAGADTGPIREFIASLRAGHELETALAGASAPEHVRAFVHKTFAIIGGGNLHEIAAAFTYGREDLIPSLFSGIVARVDESSNGCLQTFLYYLKRHIELDGDEHGALGREMVELLCDGQAQRQVEALSAAADSLMARIALWDGIAVEIDSFRNSDSSGANQKSEAPQGAADSDPPPPMANP